MVSPVFRDIPRISGSQFIGPKSVKFYVMMWVGVGGGVWGVSEKLGT